MKAFVFTSNFESRERKRQRERDREKETERKRERERQRERGGVPGLHAGDLRDARHILLISPSTVAHAGAVVEPKDPWRRSWSLATEL